jgi:hypothetical protein
VSSGQFSAAPPNADNTASTLSPAQPVSSNGQIVGQPSVQPGVVIRRPAGTVSNGTLNLLQQGARDD